jgi:hypothetical protein
MKTAMKDAQHNGNNTIQSCICRTHFQDGQASDVAIAFTKHASYNGLNNTTRANSELIRPHSIDS